MPLTRLAREALGWFGLSCVLVIAASACGSDTAVTATIEDAAAGPAEASESPRDEPVSKVYPSLTADEPGEVEQATEARPDPVFDPEATPLELEGPLPPDTYFSDIVGAPLSMTVPEGWILVENFPTGVAVLLPPSAGEFDRGVVITRPTGLSDPANPIASHLKQDAWPATDILGWLKNVGDDIVVTSGPTNTTLGGRPAVHFDLRVADDADCPSSGVETRGPAPCAHFFAMGENRDAVLPQAVDVRVWWVDGGAEAPIVVHVGAGQTGPDFFDDAEPITSSLAFGEPGPNPMGAALAEPWTVGVNGTAPAGEVVLPIADGLVLNLLGEQEILWAGRGFARLPISGTGTEVDILQPLFASGVPLESIDEVVQVFLSSDSFRAVELEPTSIGGYPTRVLELSDGTGTFAPTVGVWTHPEEGRIWLLDTPRGPLMFTAERIQGGEAIDDALTFAESLMASFTFADENDG